MVPERDAAEIVELIPSVEGHPELRPRWQAECARLIDAVGTDDPLPGGPDMPAEFGAAGRYFYVLVFLGVLPHVRRFHVERGISDAISWASLADLGEEVALYRREYGVGGLRTQWWLSHHLRGALYRLGRLQFGLSRHDDARVLDTHIPEWGEPFTEAACDVSFAAARPFFDAHFPEHGARIAVCTSWMLDPQLADYLSATSRILAFQRRFTLYDDPPEPVEHGRTMGDRSVLGFVFHQPRVPLAELTQDTTLQRAAVAHIRAGRHWAQRSGWLTLP
jgi:GNAT-like C-terminal domain/N-acyltransferase N-terminal domain